jgi:hypothetical protein
MSALPTVRPEPGEYAPFFAGYVARVAGDDVLAFLEEQRARLAAVTALSPARETFRYAPGKWCVREVLGHLADAERIFGYRAVCIARGETASLPGWDENAYMSHAPFAERPLAEILRELDLLRQANLLALGSLDDAAWARVGRANENPASVRALAFILGGHVEHHLAVLRERYGV